MTSNDIIAFSQGLLTPVIGLTTLYIAYQQYRLARDKRRAELYERRLAVFREVENFGLKARVGKQSEDLIVGSRAVASEIVFLFGKDVKSFVDSLYAAAMDLCEHQASMSPEGLKRKGKTWEELADEEHRKLDHLRSLVTRIEEVFHPYLKQDFR